MKRVHVAISTRDLSASLVDYTQRLGCEPVVIVPGEYALWRCGPLNLSVRVDPGNGPFVLRHLGWEDPEASAFSEDADVNGIVWECFTAGQQACEINRQWPGTGYRVATDDRSE